MLAPPLERSGRREEQRQHRVEVLASLERFSVFGGAPQLRGGEFDGGAGPFARA